MLLVNLLPISAYFSPINEIIDPNTIPDPFLNQESDSKEQSGFISKKIEDGFSDSSSTNKELFDDLADNKLPVKAPLPQSGDALLTNEKLEDFNKAYTKALKLEGSISSITDKDMWERLHKYIINNWGKFLIDGHFSIGFQIRYVMCSYVIAFIPGEFAFVIPGFYTYLIPKKAYNVPIISDALKGLKKFFKFCKKTSRDKLFITFYFGRSNSIQQDLDFIKNIPVMITNNPLGILRELLGFRIKAEGYNPEVN